MIPTNFEEIFKASQETLNQFLITELPINIFLVSAEGYICWANNNLLNLVNVNSLQEVIGMHISHWDECRWDAIQEVIRTKQETIVEEFYNEIFFSTVRKPVIQNNKLIGILGLSINITGKKQAELAKQQFMMNMAHDLRTPLAGIIGIASIQANEK
ncbi:histidine kinase dimerization/phospho-acceptor domain-containing protein, partial [Rickettsiella grylli]|uniref:histidine kinase dimerization/phospho-acceptor domain-containing protein n=1 Tax=Rickettsiella grylli TaxID=59196 RepID=UPI000A6FD575